MDADIVKQTILFHAGYLESMDSKKIELTATFRPYVGLREDLFADLIHAISNIETHIPVSGPVDRDLVSALWWICHRARVLILDENSSVRRSSRIDNDSVARIHWWVEILETASLRFLQGRDRAVCMSRFLQYLIEMPPDNPRIYDFTHPLLRECCVYDDQDIASQARKAARTLGLDV